MTASHENINGWFRDTNSRRLQAPSSFINSTPSPCSFLVYLTKKLTLGNHSMGTYKYTHIPPVFSFAIHYHTTTEIRKKESTNDKATKTVLRPLQEAKISQLILPLLVKQRDIYTENPSFRLEQWPPLQVITNHKDQNGMDLSIWFCKGTDSLFSTV